MWPYPIPLKGTGERCITCHEGGEKGMSGRENFLGLSTAENETLFVKKGGGNEHAKKDERTDQEGIHPTHNDFEPNCGWGTLRKGEREGTPRRLMRGKGKKEKSWEGGGGGSFDLLVVEIFGDQPHPA